MTRVRLLVPDMPDSTAIEPYLRKIDEGRWYTNFGPLSLAFEGSISAILGVPAAAVCSVANCTLGLEIALATMGLKNGARVLVPALTFVATATAVVRSGFSPVLADVDEESWILTPQIARAVLATSAVDCVVPVASFGCPVDIAEWDQFARDTGIPVLVDAAGAFGNQAVGGVCKVAYSFHATKTLGMGEGGLVACADQAWIEQFRKFTNFGIDPPTGLSCQAGSNAKLSEYHAAVGLASLKSWGDRADRRRALHRKYVLELRNNCPQVVLQKRPDDGVYSIMQIRLPDGVSSGAVASALLQADIETRRWYLPLLDSHPAFAKFQTRTHLPVAHALATSLLGLPFHLGIDGVAVEHVCAQLAFVLNGNLAGDDGTSIDSEIGKSNHVDCS